MHDFWLAVLVVSLVPAAVASLVCNPLVIAMLGVDAWREQVRRVYPYRWWIGCSLVTLALSTIMLARIARMERFAPSRSGGREADLQ